MWEIINNLFTIIKPKKVAYSHSHYWYNDEIISLRNCGFIPEHNSGNMISMCIMSRGNEIVKKIAYRDLNSVDSYYVLECLDKPGVVKVNLFKELLDIISIEKRRDGIIDEILE